VIIGMQFGIYGLVTGQVVAVYLAVFINTWYTDRLLGYPLSEQIKDIAATVGFSMVAGFAAFLFNAYVKTTGIYVLLGGGGISFALYGLLHLTASTKEVHFIKTFVIPKIRKFITGRDVYRISKVS
ncbi:MAG TPA: hypothetical protein PK228_19980, partial [Saprospiraceae bacterium]|nr:hypothetical protein [Saprospiraceae bacterium]